MTRINDPAGFRLDEPLQTAESEHETAARRESVPAELAVVIPTLNERENVAVPVGRLDAVRSGIRWEAVFVDDDPPDGTADTVRALARRRGKLRCIPKLVGHVVPIRLLLFAMIGGIGVSTHLAVLRLAIGAFGIAFPAGQAIAAATAMTGNFLLNNIFTYRDRRLGGRALARGLLSFCAVCGIGVAANVALASHLFASGCPWWLAAIGGAGVSVLWNCAMASKLVWRPHPRAPARRLPTAATAAGRPGAAAPPPALTWAAD